MSVKTDRESMIRHLIETTNLERPDAEEIVSIHLGESHGDIVPSRPMSVEERRRFGLGLTWDQARARRQARADQAAAPEHQ